MECPLCGGDIEFHDSFDLENCLIQSIKEIEKLKEVIRKCDKYKY